MIGRLFFLIGMVGWVAVPWTRNLGRISRWRRWRAVLRNTPELLDQAAQEDINAANASLHRRSWRLREKARHREGSTPASTSTSSPALAAVISLNHANGMYAGRFAIPVELGTRARYPLPALEAEISVTVESRDTVKQLLGDAPAPIVDEPPVDDGMATHLQRVEYP